MVWSDRVRLVGYPEVENWQGRSEGGFGLNLRLARYPLPYPVPNRFSVSTEAIRFIHQAASIHYYSGISFRAV